MGKYSLFPCLFLYGFRPEKKYLQLRKSWCILAIVVTLIAVKREVAVLI